MTTVSAPAKVNLFLRVCGKASSGLHLLDSVIIFTDFGDRITIRPAVRDKLKISGPFAEILKTLSDREDDNLVMLALAAFRRAGGVIGSVEIHLEKHIPVGAGLGGGSTDAAAILRALNNLASVQLGEESLLQIAASLGADVPVCLSSHSQRIGGIGDRLTRCKVKPAHILLVNPLKHLATAAVFANFKGPASGHAGSLDEQDVVALVAHGNDLLPAAAALLPEINDTLKILGESPGCKIASMSGSGASCFGVFSDPQKTSEAARKMHDCGFWAVPTNIKTAI
jgi:4-diphosphocytidyl-2-C-methyl-D-erythritol kinase